MKYYYYGIAIILYLILSIPGQKATTTNPSPDISPIATVPAAAPLAKVTQKDYDTLLDNVKKLSHEIEGLKNTIKTQEAASKETLRTRDECLISLVNSLATSVNLSQHYVILKDFDDTAKGFLSKVPILGMNLMLKFKNLQNHLDIYQHKIDYLTAHVDRSLAVASR